MHHSLYKWPQVLREQPPRLPRLPSVKDFQEVSLAALPQPDIFAAQPPQPQGLAPASAPQPQPLPLPGQPGPALGTHISHVGAARPVR